jgi:lipoic acid synthetase
MGECWGAGTATFMILGNVCTRSCGFCAVQTGKPSEVDYFEPAKVAESVHKMNLSHCVVTSVDRDDLKDGGAEIWAMTVRAIRHKNPNTTLETLIPDFAGKWENLQNIIDVAPEIVSHNLETVRRLTKQVRIQAKYDRSLEVLFRLKKGGMRTKSGVMLGLGESHEEVLETMEDLRSVNVDILTLGQYLQPTPKHLPVQEFITPERFEEYRIKGLEMGFRYVESGPLVRSSYHAEKHIFEEISKETILKINKMVIEFHSNQIKEIIIDKLVHFGFVIQKITPELIFTYNPEYYKKKKKIA